MQWLKFGYLVWCLPTATILQKWPIAKTMFATQVLYGFVLIGTGFANNFASLMVLRVLLGVFEAPIVPGNFLVLGMWYSRKYVSTPASVTAQ
jgi:ACS family allantoate permease-like MFS transporter